LALEHDDGSHYPLDWLARVMAMSGSSSGDDEAKGYGATVRHALRFAAILEDLRLRPLDVRARVDNDSLRLACQRGSSPRMGHLRKTASLNFRLIKQVGMVPERVDSCDNLADFLTKILGRERLAHLLKAIMGLNLGKNTHGVVISRGRNANKECVNYVRHSQTCSFGNVWDLGLMLESERVSQHLRSCFCRDWGAVELD